MYAIRSYYGTVAIEGWYDDQMKMPKEVRDEIAAISASMDYDAILKKYGLPQFIGEKGYSPIERTWIRGSLDVTGMKSGYTEGAASIVPVITSYSIHYTKLYEGRDPRPLLAG